MRRRPPVPHRCIVPCRCAPPRTWPRRRYRVASCSRSHAAAAPHAAIVLDAAGGIVNVFAAVVVAGAIGFIRQLREVAPDVDGRGKGRERHPRGVGGLVVPDDNIDQILRRRLQVIDFGARIAHRPVRSSIREFSRLSPLLLLPPAPTRHAELGQRAAVAVVTTFTQAKKLPWQTAGAPEKRCPDPGRGRDPELGARDFASAKAGQAWLGLRRAFVPSLACWRLMPSWADAAGSAGG